MADVDRARGIVDAEHGRTGSSDGVDRNGGWREPRESSQAGRSPDPLVGHRFQLVGRHRQDDADRVGGVEGSIVLHVDLSVLDVGVERVGYPSIAIDADGEGAVGRRLDHHGHRRARSDTGERVQLPATSWRTSLGVRRGD